MADIWPVHQIHADGESLILGSVAIARVADASLAEQIAEACRERDIMRDALDRVRKIAIQEMPRWSDTRDKIDKECCEAMTGRLAI